MAVRFESRNHRRCSRTKPSCEHCIKRNVECVYVEPKRKGRPLKQRQKAGTDTTRWVNECTTSRAKRPRTDTDTSALEIIGSSNSNSSGGDSHSTDITSHTRSTSSSSSLSSSSSSSSSLSLASLFQLTDSKHSLPIPSSSSQSQSHTSGITAHVSIPRPSREELEQHRRDLQFFLVNVILDENTLTITKYELWQHLDDSQNDQVRNSTAFRIREVYMIAARLHVLQRLGVDVAQHRPHYRLAIAILQDSQLIDNISVSNAKNLAAALFMLVSYLMTCPSDMHQFNSQLITIAKYWAHTSLEMYRTQYGEPKMQDPLYECIARILHVSIPHCDVSSYLLDPVFCTSTRLVEKLQLLSLLIPVIPHGDKLIATLRDIPEVNVERCTQVLDSVVSEIRIHSALPIVGIVSKIVFYGLKLDYLLQIESCIQIGKHLQDRMHVDKELKIMREQIDTTTDIITQLYANNISRKCIVCYEMCTTL